MQKVQGTETAEQTFLDHLELIEEVVRYICRRYQLTLDDREDFASDVRLKLIEDDYAVLRKFQGNSSLRTFLVTVVYRALLDYRIRKWGKWRLSEKAKRLGPIAEKLERLVNRDRYSAEEAFEILRINHRVELSYKELEDLHSQLPRRTPRRIGGEEELAEIPTERGQVEANLIERERHALQDDLASAANRAVMVLTAQERLMLRMHFWDGFSWTDVAEAFGWPRRRAYQEKERILRCLKRLLEADGHSGRNLEGILGGQRSDLRIELRGQANR